MALLFGGNNSGNNVLVNGLLSDYAAQHQSHQQQQQQYHEHGYELQDRNGQGYDIEVANLTHMFLVADGMVQRQGSISKYIQTPLL
jgi:hypothetical protein